MALRQAPFLPTPHSGFSGKGKHRGTSRLWDLPGFVSFWVGMVPLRAPCAFKPLATITWKMGAEQSLLEVGGLALPASPSSWIPSRPRRPPNPLLLPRTVALLPGETVSAAALRPTAPPRPFPSQPPDEPDLRTSLTSQESGGREGRRRSGSGAWCPVSAAAPQAAGRAGMWPHIPEGRVWPACSLPGLELPLCLCLPRDPRLVA